MNAKILSQAVLAVEGHHPHMQVVLLQMAAKADKTGVCRLTQAMIADACCLSLDSVQRALKGLEEAGLIRREFDHRRDGKRRADKTTILPDNAAVGGVVRGSQDRSQRHGQSRAERHGQYRSQRQPIEGYITPAETQPAKPCQEGGFESAANDSNALTLIIGGRVA